MQPVVLTKWQNAKLTMATKAQRRAMHRLGFADWRIDRTSKEKARQLIADAVEAEAEFREFMGEVGGTDDGTTK